MHYRIGLSLFEAVRTRGDGEVDNFDVDGEPNSKDPPGWFTDAIDTADSMRGITEQDGDFEVVWNGNSVISSLGDWIAFFPETGALLVLDNELFQQLMPLPVVLERPQ